ncbi:hypothetical protein [Cohnella sp. 56]|uniref:hypothetical protein n=1 Tax=Cohnella sp. 56 TaxID=3113722 RepID=UPI0030E7D99B
MKKYIVLLMLLLMTTACAGKVSPLDESDFKLSYELSNPRPKLGDTIELRATLQNVTKHTLDFDGGSQLIHIHVIKPGDPDQYIDADAGRIYSLKPLEKRTRMLPIMLDKKGKYKVYIATSRLTAHINGPSKVIAVNLDPVYIDVQ